MQIVIKNRFEEKLYQFFQYFTLCCFFQVVLLTNHSFSQRFSYYFNTFSHYILSSQVQPHLVGAPTHQTKIINLTIRKLYLAKKIKFRLFSNNSLYQNLLILFIVQHQFLIHKVQLTLLKILKSKTAAQGSSGYKVSLTLRTKKNTNTCSCTRYMQSIKARFWFGFGSKQS